MPCSSSAPRGPALPVDRGHPSTVPNVSSWAASTLSPVTSVPLFNYSRSKLGSLGKHSQPGARSYVEAVAVVINYAIPDDLHRKAKAAAALRGLSLKAFVILALQRLVDEEVPDKET